MVGIGILGCGTIGPLHAEAVAGIAGARLVAVADQHLERAEEVARGAGGDVVARGDLHGLLAVPGVDLVCVCTPSGTHADLGCAIAEAGRHVVLEKPIDTDPGAAERVLKTAAKAGVVLSVIAQHRFDEGFARLHRAIGAGELGEVVLGEGRAWWYRTQAYYDADAWRGTWALDGGALSNQGVHLVDLLLWLLGPVDSVFARSRTAAHAMEAEDVIVASLRFASGALGALTVTTASYPGAPETIAVAGPEASVLVESGRVVSWRSARGAAEEDGAVGLPAASAARGSRGLAVDAHRAQLQDVVDAVREQRRPAVTGEDGCAALAVVAAAYASARDGGDVTVA